MKAIPTSLAPLHARLLEQVHKLEADLRSFDAWRLAQLGYGNALVDDSSVAFDQATQMTLRRNTEARLQQVRAALSRLETGNYGVCEGCSETIDLERLLAAPHARLCIACQRLTERSPLGRMLTNPGTDGLQATAG